MFYSRYTKPGCYRFLDDQARTIYVGKSKNINKRINQHFSDKGGHLGKEFYNDVARVEIIKTKDHPTALALEQYLINKYKPKGNKSDKSKKINSKVVNKADIPKYENLIHWETYRKFKNYDKDKISTTERKSKITTIISYTIFISIICYLFIKSF